MRDGMRRHAHMNVHGNGHSAFVQNYTPGHILSSLTPALLRGCKLKSCFLIKTRKHMAYGINKSIYSQYIKKDLYNMEDQRLIYTLV